MTVLLSRKKAGGHRQCLLIRTAPKNYFQLQKKIIIEAQQEFLATGAVPQNEGQRTSPADNSVEPVLNVLRRHLFVNQNELKCRLDENGEPVLF